MPLPTFSSRDELAIQLQEMGFATKDGKTKKSIVIELPRGGDRIATLQKIANDFVNYGGKYNPSGGQSSVGRTELRGSYYVECKIKGGGGSGAGSDLTKLTESAQCVYSAALYAGKGYTQKELKSVSSAFDVDEKLDNIFKKLPDDWIESSKIIAERLKKEFPPNGKNYVHHRGSKWVDKLERHWKKLNKDAGNPFSNLNKWSPADIWMISDKGAKVDITKTKSLVELNNLLIENLKSKDIIGVSLKKAVGTARYKELNTSKKRPTFKFERTTTGLRGFFESGDGYLFFEGGKAQFRTFGSTWQGELKGKNANMGKMSGGPIQRLVEDISKKKFRPQRELKDRNEKNIESFWNWYKSVPYHDKMTKTQFMQNIKDKDHNWYVSKILTTQLIAMVESLNDKQKDEFSSGMVNYAGSESELSGPYVKLY